jgi:hypothetical protein
MQTDLEAVVLDKSIPLSAADIKSYMRMLLLSVEVCHKQYILHRVRDLILSKRRKATFFSTSLVQLP